MNERKLMDITGYEFNELLKDETRWLYEWVEGDLSLEVTINFDRGEGSCWIQYKNHETRIYLPKDEVTYKLRYALDYAQFLDNPMASQANFAAYAELAVELGQYGLDIVGTEDSLSMWTEFSGVLVTWDGYKYELVNDEGLAQVAGTPEGAASWITYLEKVADRIKEVKIEKEIA